MTSRPPTCIQHAVPLAERTTLGLGGSAEYFIEASDEDMLVDALQFARERSLPITILGGGSNVIVADEGVRGLVVAPRMRGVKIDRARFGNKNLVLVTAAAGEPWDELVAHTVCEGISGLECLSGIPGLVGGVPFQNVGAYGVEVADSIALVRSIDVASSAQRERANRECAFDYRTSWFRNHPGSEIITEVSFTLFQNRPASPPSYAELSAAISVEPHLLTPGIVRDTVVRLRAAKSMVLAPLAAPDDPNLRSAGSFFTNPQLTRTVIDDIAQQALKRDLIRTSAELPIFPGAHALFKVPAAWLVERSGFSKGTRRGAFGISTRHSLAVVHHGGGTTRELLAFATEIQDAVSREWNVRLELEPVLLGRNAGTQ